MIAQYDNLLMSSFVLWLDHTISAVGSGYYPRLVQFWPEQQVYAGVYSYNSPFTQFVSDSSLSGANVPTGIFMNGVYCGIGQSGLMAIDYNKGRVYVSGVANASIEMISGSVKEIPVLLTSEPETKLLFETKYENKPKTYNIATGLANNFVPYPVIFVKSNSSRNEPFQFGGTQNTINNIRILAFCDSQFQLDAVMGIIRDQKRGYVPILSESEFPYNSYGFLKSGYHYDNLTAPKLANGEAAYIEDIYISKTNQNSYSQALKDLNPMVYIGIADMEISKPRDI